MAVNRTTGQTPRQFLRRKLIEGPNNVLPWSADFKFRIYFVKLTSKFGKIGLLDDPGGQGSSPNVWIWIGFEQWARIKASKREIQIWLLLDFTVGL
jgi:hypothetical protein